MNTSRSAALILIGEELLSGKIDDANGVHAIGALRKIGVELREIRMIGDEIERIGEVVREAAARYDVVFTSGGVGPTHDDLTMRGIAHGFERPLERHDEMLAIIHERFGANEAQTRIWERMAMLPRGCDVVISEATRVPIFRLDNVWILPGVPELFRLQFDQIARDLHGVPTLLRTIYVNVGEGDLAPHLDVVVSAHPNATIGSYPVLHADDHRTRLTVESKDEHVMLAAFDELLERMPTEWVVRLGDQLRIGEH